MSENFLLKILVSESEDYLDFVMCFNIAHQKFFLRRILSYSTFHSSIDIFLDLTGLPKVEVSLVVSELLNRVTRPRLRPSLPLRSLKS